MSWFYEMFLEASIKELVSSFMFLKTENNFISF